MVIDFERERRFRENTKEAIQAILKGFSLTDYLKDGEKNQIVQKVVSLENQRRKYNKLLKSKTSQAEVKGQISDEFGRAAFHAIDSLRNIGIEIKPNEFLDLSKTFIANRKEYGEDMPSSYLINNAIIEICNIVSTKK